MIVRKRNLMPAVDNCLPLSAARLRRDPIDLFYARSEKKQTKKPTTTNQPTKQKDPKRPPAKNYCSFVKPV